MVHDENENQNRELGTYEGIPKLGGILWRRVLSLPKFVGAGMCQVHTEAYRAGSVSYRGPVYRANIPVMLWYVACRTRPWSKHAGSETISDACLRWGHIAPSIS